MRSQHPVEVAMPQRLSNGQTIFEPNKIMGDRYGPVFDGYVPVFDQICAD